MPCIGLDLDNTIIDYGPVFGAVAEEVGLLRHGSALTSKLQVKCELLRRSEGERDWMFLQSQVYGRFLEHAEPYPGLDEVFQFARQSSLELCIISHKTRHGHFDPMRIDLREAAMNWLEGRGFFSANGYGLGREQVYFEDTRDHKIKRIGALGVRVFVDDLPEVLLHPAFPFEVERLWFAPGREIAPEGLTPLSSWSEICRRLREVLTKEPLTAPPVHTG